MCESDGKGTAVQEPSSRSLLIDVVRGMAISLVALGHTNQGILHRGWWGNSNAGVRLNAAIYAFHMPAFFFVSGIFLRSSVQKRGPRHFVVTRLRTILYPYALWSVPGALAVWILAPFVSQTLPTIRQFLIGFLTGTTGWFFPTLFLCLMFGLAFLRLPGIVTVAIAIAAFFLHPVTGVNFVDRALDFFPFLAAGMWVGRSFELLERVPKVAALVLAASLCTEIFVLAGRDWDNVRWIYLPAGYLGTLMLLLFARSLGATRASSILAWVGEASLAIYLMGEYGQGAMRQALIWAHIKEPYVQLLVPTLPAILVPAWIYQRRIRLHLEWLFVAPLGKQAMPAPQNARAR